MADYRDERDAMGVVRVPADAYFGAQTQRAASNFPISGLRMPTPFIRALAQIKYCAAAVNAELDLMAKDLAEAIQAAAEEALAGRFDDQFVVDVFQTGSGTSTNMNMNEVLASRANELITGEKGGKSPVHPNDHVNLGQSSNDVIPSTIHLAAYGDIYQRLIPALDRLKNALYEKANAFASIRKIGRTHLQDAVPITLGQEFSGYARQVEMAEARLTGIEPCLAELALGGTAVGTGLNTHPEFASRTIGLLSRRTGLAVFEANNHFYAQATQDTAVAVSGVLKNIAAALVKIANDIRWLASGPRCGLGEITIPSLQPGSSIMPGKVNPVIPEAVIQVAFQVMGNDTAITLGGQSGNFELNVCLPLIAYNLLQSVDLLASVIDVFVAKCVEGVTANVAACEGYIENSLALVTGLVPHLGYDRASELAKEAFRAGRTIRQVATASGELPESVIREVLGPPPGETDDQPPD